MNELRFADSTHEPVPLFIGQCDDHDVAIPGAVLVPEGERMLLIGEERLQRAAKAARHLIPVWPIRPVRQCPEVVEIHDVLH